MVVLDSATSTSQSAPPDWIIYPACQYTFEQLAEIYNATRIDYIVPMPMSARRMEEYVHDYDVDLKHSIVITGAGGHPAGIGMLGRRGRRGWLTRLGIVPHLRQHRLGHLLMRELLEYARALELRQLQLEVIVGNEPAQRLFTRYDFMPTRELLVLSRPPSAALPAQDTLLRVEALERADIQRYLVAGRRLSASWIDEPDSLIRNENLTGFLAHHPDGSSGWVACRRSRFQITHFAVDVPPHCAYDMILALFTALHRAFPTQDAKFENFPADAAGLDALHLLGYIEVFRRIEMQRPLP